MAARTMILLGLLAVLPAGAQTATRPRPVDVEAEFDFAAALMKEELNSYAVLVAQRIAEEHPDKAGRATVVRAEALVAARHFEQAEAIIQELPPGSPETDAIRLALADGYYRLGDLDRCRALYDEFFERHGETVPEDPELLRFYRLAAYKYAQMLLQQGLLSETIRVYDLLIAATEDADMLRQIRLEQSELMLRHARQQKLEGDALDELVEKVQEHCNAIIWGGMDLWFGRAVICLAEMEALALREDEAMRLLQTNLDMLRTLDQTLAEADIPLSESPLAGARSILGNLFDREAGVLLGSRTERERRALLDFDRAFDEAEALWNLMGRIHRRDAGLVRRLDGRTDTLRGTVAERQAPFEEMDDLLREFETLLQTGAEGQDWAGDVAEPLAALRERVTKLRESLAGFDRRLGITPSPELAFGPRFGGRSQLDRAARWLGPQAERRERAITLKTRALQQFYNVFASYPDSGWSEDAGPHVERLREELEELTGKSVTIRMAAGGERKLGLVHMSEGHDLFSRNQYERAVDAYMQGLALHPEGDESVVALSSLLESQARLERMMDVNVTAAYLAERFASSSTAAQGLLRVGRYFFEQKNEPMYTSIYNLYIDHFPDHPGAQMILYMLGEQRWGEKDYMGAYPYYATLVERYRRGGYVLSALERMAWAHYLRGDFLQAAERFKILLERSHPGRQQAQAKLSYADSLRQTGNYQAAFREYRELMTWLTESDTVYTQRDQRDEFRKLHEQSMFFQAYCLSRLETPEARIPAFRTAAIRLYLEFVDTFPDSNLAPLALSSVGAIHIIQDQNEEAAAVYARLTETYPDSEAGRNSRLAMVRSLVDVGQVARARSSVREMLAARDEFPAEHFLRIGLLMLDSSQYTEAAQALDLAIVRLRETGELEQNPGLEQRALFGSARANLALGQYEKAISAANTLMERYPRSAMFYDMRFVLGQAYRQMGQTERAIEVLREVFQRATDQVLMNRATLELGRIQEADGQIGEALASYQRIVLLADPNDPDIRPIFETALARGTVLQATRERWRDVIESARLYNELFPQGPGHLEVQQALTRARVQVGGNAGGGTE